MVLSAVRRTSHNKANLAFAGVRLAVAVDELNRLVKR